MSSSNYPYLVHETPAIDVAADNANVILLEWLAHYRPHVREDMREALVGTDGVALTIAAMIVQLEEKHDRGGLLPQVTDALAFLRSNA